ncbi:hypothetical protein [Kineococcus rhizosphaerae]|uniref:Uncharacterized protein n=1 Tax=Kineococcus rhizosphaerae TaxID=559628 RepID=A0A2T0QX92_9ACTN|nr:hypothetical protein [Kineococcus rhizosphaerae]PRY10504.1 hypothetical protein CLV37_11657 [Kineococcus rhizosphaerae]
MEVEDRSERAAARASAYLYGDVLVLAALIALEPSDVASAKGLTYVLGTTVSTFVAHVLADAVGASTRSGGRVPTATLLHEVRDAVPIASAGLGPAALMVLALLHVWTPTVALELAVLVTVLRLAVLGWVVGRLRGGRPSLRTFVAGVLLAVAGAGAAVLKWWLTH